jgi:hypothetical protein
MKFAEQISNSEVERQEAPRTTWGAGIWRDIRETSADQRALFTLACKFQVEPIKDSFLSEQEGCRSFALQNGRNKY